MTDDTYKKEDQLQDRKQAERIEANTEQITETTDNSSINLDTVITRLDNFEKRLELSHTSVAGTISNVQSEVQKLNGNGKIIKFLKKDIGLGITILLFLSGLFGAFYSLRNDISINAIKTDNVLQAVQELKVTMKESINDRSQLNTRVSIIESFMKHLGLKI